MKTSIINRDNALLSIVDKLSSKRKDIFKMYEKNYPCSRQDITEKYLIPINVVSGRTTELVDAFLLVECGSKENRWTGKMNTQYRPVKNLNERVDLINKAFVELREYKDKLVNDFNLDLSNVTKVYVEKEIIKVKSKIKSLGNILDTIQQFN